MTINQLFRKKPSIDIVENIVQSFGLKNLSDESFFSKKDLEQNNLLDNIRESVNILNDYYLPCKAKIYLSNLSYKRSITILRQCLKLYDYSLKSREQYLKSEKLIIYQIVSINNKPKDNKNNDNKCIISFD